MVYIVGSMIMTMIIVHTLLVINKKLIGDKEVELNCREYIGLFLNKELDEVELRNTKADQYNSFTNVIGIIDFESKKIIDVVNSIHEAGHYKSLNSNKIYLEIFNIGQVIVIINRIFIIPLIILFFVANIRFLPLFFFYLFATILRLFIGISNEYISSKLALQFFKQKWSCRDVSIARSTYTIAFLDHLFVVLTISITILGMYFEYVN